MAPFGQHFVLDSIILVVIRILGDTPRYSFFRLHFVQGGYPDACANASLVLVAIV